MKSLEMQISERALYPPRPLEFAIKDGPSLSTYDIENVKERIAKILDNFEEKLIGLIREIPEQIRNYIREQKEYVYVKFSSSDELKKAFDYLWDNKLPHRPMGFRIISIPRYAEQQLKEADFNYEFSEVK